MTEEYDESTCITAGELREIGCAVDAAIPDCGWLSRAAIHFVPGNAATMPGGGGIQLSIAVEFTEPFRWIEACVTITG